MRGDFRVTSDKAEQLTLDSSTSAVVIVI